MNDRDDDPLPEPAIVTALSDALRRTSAQASELVEEHRESYGEILPVLLTTDVARWFVEAATSSDGAALAPAEDAVMVLAELFSSGGDGVEETISTGFVEAMPDPGAPERWVVDRLPAALREELRNVESGWEQP